MGWKPGDHQNFDPSLLPKKLQLIFMRMNQFFFSKFFSKMADSKKLTFSKPPILNGKRLTKIQVELQNIFGPIVLCTVFFAKKTKQETSVTIGTFFLKNESTFLERPSLFSLTNFQFSSQNKLIDMHCESSQKYFIELDI